MKTLYRYLALALLIVLNTSCLKSGLDELETYDQMILPIFDLNTDGGMKLLKDFV